MSGTFLAEAGGPVDVYANIATTCDNGSTSDSLVSTPIDVKGFERILFITRAWGGTDSDASATWKVQYQTSYPAYATLPASDYAVDASTDIWLDWTGANNGTVGLTGGGLTTSDGIAPPSAIDINVADVIGTGGGSVRLEYKPGQAKMRFVTSAFTYGGTRHAQKGNATDRVIK